MEKKKEGGDQGGLIYQNLRKLINIVDELRDVGLQQYINLPRIAVLGTQSAGKSSVLENIVGLDFLPRGDGVVTRRPLELRLNHIQDENTKPWGIFEEIPGKKFYDFPNEVKGNIISLTDKVAGTKCGIVDKPIVLNIYSHTCPDLTLIDLPGITRIPMAGSDQPKNIEEITKGMARRYVSDPRTIILCVTSANADLSTSDGLMMAKEVDPNGIRTIGVLTKIDIMDKGTNAKRMLTGQDIPLRLGYVGIKNRSQQDILENMSVKDAIEREKLYFATHPLYSTMPPGLLGTEVLSTKCSKVMFTHIKHNLPEITKEIREKAKDIEDRLRDLGPPLPQGATDKMQLMWNMITDVVTIYKNTISGKFDSRRAGASGQPSNAKRELSGGAKIKLHFYNLYKQLANYNATSEYTDGDIEKAIMLHEGDTIPGFPSVDVFVYLIQPQLEKLREPALDLLQDVYHMLEQMCQGIVDKIFQRFPSMIPEVMDIIVTVLQEEREKTRVIVESLIDAEQNYLFTNDTDYLSNRTDIVPQEQQQPQNQNQLNQQNQSVAGSQAQPQNQNRPPPQNNNMKGSNVFVKEIRARIDAYYKIAVRNVRDTIPKAIGFFLVKQSQERLQFELYAQMNKNDNLAKSLGEPERVAEERKSLNATLETLKKALKVLQRDPDISNTSFGEDELAEELRMDAERRRREATAQKAGPPNGGGQMNQSFQSNQQNFNGNPNPNMGMGGPVRPPGQGPPMGNPPMGNPPMGGGGPPMGNPPMGGVRPGGPPQGVPPGGVRPPGVPPSTGSLFGNSGAGDPLKK